MKRITFLISALVISLTSMAQTYKLSDMTETTFAAGGDSQWSFEKYNYTKGLYSKLTTYTDSSTCNYVDIYQPERVGGNRITEIDNVTANGENTWAGNIRYAWCDQKFVSPRTNSEEKFVYVCRDTREGYGFELFGNKTNSSVITFTAPTDGYYKVDGTVIREDGNGMTAINILPRYRYASATNIDSLSSQSNMGYSFAYGEGGSQINTYDGKKLFADGGSQIWTPQTPTSFTLAYQAKTGDKISFEVNVSSLNLTSDWARDAWSRTFFQKLEIATVDEATAKADSNFVNPYGTEHVTALTDSTNNYMDKTINLEEGTSLGQYPSTALSTFNSVCENIMSSISNGTINEMNASGYLIKLQNAWIALMGSKIITDFEADGNYRLFYSTGNTSNNNLVVNYDTSKMGKNDNSPWGFDSYDVATGTYTAFTTHGTGSKFGSSTISAWYNSSSDWFYLADNGNMHPLTTKSPVIMFTAQKNGVYKVNFGCYRTNPNVSVENPLYIHSRFMTSATTNCSSDNAMFSKQYGSVANDGAKGKAPITMTYFVNMKSGDKITFEEDAYTSNKNSSANTQITDLSICSCVTSDSVYTLAIAKASGLDVFNPYSSGDATALKAEVTYVDSVLNAHANQIGSNAGQYSTDSYNTLTALIAEAKEYIEIEGDESATQLIYDNEVINLKKAVTAFLTSRIPYEKIISGDYGIRLANTDKFLCQNNNSGNGFYYAAFLNATGAATDAARFTGVTVADYNWTFTFTRNDSLKATNITNSNGYLSPDAYVIAGEDLNPQSNIFNFYTENEGDSLFTVKRPDGTYWTNTINWSSPYNKISTSTTPQYIFVLDSRTLTSVNSISSDTDVKAVSVKYYTIDGRLTSKQQKGFVIKRIIYSDGSTKAIKMIVK
jgi:hypothetical protein